jgi:hypothetical protein
LSRAVLLQQVEAERERRQYNRDAEVLWYTFRDIKNDLPAPAAVLLRHGAILRQRRQREREDAQDTGLWRAPDSSLAFRIASLFARDTDVVTWRMVLELWIGTALAHHQQAQEAWKRRKCGAAFPDVLRDLQARATTEAIACWRSIERAAAGIAWDYKEEWKPTIQAVRLNRATNTLTPEPAAS